MHSCPNHATLDRFAVGDLEDHDADLIQSHLHDCASCLATIEGLAHEDTLVRAMRAQATSAGVAKEPAIERLITRLQARSDCMHAGAGDESLTESQILSGSPSLLAPAEAPDEIGRLGPYRVQRLLGKGGMGLVLQAQDAQLRRTVALKVLRSERAADPGQRQRFLREARAAASLHHDHIVTIYHVGEERGLPYLAMEYLRGETLEDRLRRTGRLEVAEVLRLGSQIAEGLAAAHHVGLIHRDIKPANIWLESREDSQDRVKILDFGLARPMADDAHLTQEGMIAGTPHYMAPEQAAGQAIDGRCDLFSLGCVLYRMATGQLPFPGDSTRPVLHALAESRPAPPRQHCPELPPAVNDLILRLLARAPANRPRTARAVAAELAALELAPARSAPGQRPKRTALLAVAAGMLLVVGVAGSLCGPAVYRFTTNQGQLVIETEDADVEVTVKQNGERVAIVDRKTGHTVTLTSGDYVAELTGGPKGLQLVAKQFTLSRGRQQIVHVRREPAAAGPRAAAESSAAVRFLRGHRGPIKGVAFLPGGRALSGGDDGTLRVWDMLTGVEERRLLEHPGGILKLAVSPDGKNVLTADHKGTIRLLDAADGRELRRHDFGLASGLAFSPDGRQALFSGYQGKVSLWDVALWKELRSARHYAAKRTEVCFSADGLRGFSAGFEPFVTGWDLESGQEVRTFQAHPQGTFGVARTPDGRYMLTCGFDGDTRLWNAATGKEVRRFQGHTHNVRSIAVSADGRRALTGGLDKTVRLWEIETGRELGVFEGHSSYVLSVAMSPDGRFALSGGSEVQNLALWRLPD